MSDNESSALSCEGIDGSERQSISDNDDVFDDIDNSNDFAVDKENSNENANVDYTDDTDNYRFRQNSMNDPNGSPFGAFLLH
ncbi:unnamed protein product [Anisakis simplex]|uniref:Uncharacterized protein n=1 Tax=Anisakis simplex TaxID=6269 RepID=A0A0M3J1Z1_ANISI|nr:unnamed protein product [Anisakis simplex]